MILQSQTLHLWPLQAAGRHLLTFFIGLDAKIQYPFDFTFQKHHFQFRAGVNVRNVLNYFNPRDVQQYSGSPHFGEFYNSVGRQFGIDGDFDRPVPLSQLVWGGHSCPPPLT